MMELVRSDDDDDVRKSVVFHLPRILTCFSDGSVVRDSALPALPASHHFSHGVATKDVVIHEDGGIGINEISVRIFLPEQPTTQKPRLPVVFYAHGGAYCLGDPAMPPFHGFCHRMALNSKAIWVSLRYRLAPEHPLPAAYEDGYWAFKWLQDVANGARSEPWLHDFADFSRFFLCGESAGAVLMHNVFMRLAQEDAVPPSVRGLLLVHPGFHTEAKRISMAEEAVVPGLDAFYNLALPGFHADSKTISMAQKVIVPGLDAMYKLALPHGANFDHPWVNPLNPEAPSLSRLSACPRVLVAVADKDLRFDQTIKFYEIVKSFCPDVHLVISKGKGHAFHILEGYSEEAAQLEQELAKFISSSA